MVVDKRETVLDLMAKSLQSLSTVAEFTVCVVVERATILVPKSLQSLRLCGRAA